MMKKVFILLVFIFTNLFMVFSNEVEIHDLVLETDDSDFIPVEKLYPVDVNGNKNFGFFLIKNKKKLTSTRRRHFMIMDDTISPYRSRVDDSDIIDYKRLLNKNLKPRMPFIAMMAISFPVFLAAGAGAAGLIWATVNLFDLGSGLVFLDALAPIAGIFTGLLGVGLAILSVAAFVFFVIGLIGVIASPYYYKKRIAAKKSYIIDALNDKYPSYYEEDKAEIDIFDINIGKKNKKK